MVLLRFSGQVDMVSAKNSIWYVTTYTHILYSLIYLIPNRLSRVLCPLVHWILEIANGSKGFVPVDMKKGMSTEVHWILENANDYNGILRFGKSTGL